ncbi:MAG: hypothetical protein A4E32_00816 [Methanomassiliicoccales archaeon PtaU1.Bin124]|nr:MAG: hypothetical protein A4E32_00816 [Methanomassiliicoccales archaeon PtaU1.Bin124]
MPTYAFAIIMMSNIDPKYLRTCQMSRVPSEDDLLLRREVKNVSADQKVMEMDPMEKDRPKGEGTRRMQNPQSLEH